MQHARVKYVLADLSVSAEGNITWWPRVPEQFDTHTHTYNHYVSLSYLNTFNDIP